jgi:endonuclease/exonuclease/phosphatase family metal-dependent hydrolase
MPRTPSLLLVAVVFLVAAACTATGSSGDEADDAAEQVADDASEHVDGTSPDATATGPPLRVVTLNLLHGLFCPEETDWCQAPDRVEIFAEQLEAAECPDLVGLQEIGERLAELLPSVLERTCDGEYEIAWHGQASSGHGLSQQMVLSRLPIEEQGHIELAHFPWEAYWVRVDSAQGPVGFLTAHFASGQNNPPCNPEDEECPEYCPLGMITNECHAHQVVEFFDGRTEPAALSIASGDFNATPDSSTLTTILDAGFVDVWLAGGQPECDPATHAGCTGGGDAPGPFVGMDTEEGPGYDTRIDYVTVRPGPDCAVDVDAEAFAAEPRREPLNGMWWSADHAGVLAELRCHGPMG